MSLTGFVSGLPTKKRKTTVGEVVTVNVQLFPPTDDKFPEFHLPTLIREQTGKSLDDDNPFADNEEYRKLETIAQKFEEKYGPKRDKKGRKIKFGKPEDYMDLGMGYDLEDPFIDDSEGYDELVPSTLTPIHGGFYVNRGPLEFRERSDSDDEGVRQTQETLNAKERHSQAADGQHSEQANGDPGAVSSNSSLGVSQEAPSEMRSLPNSVQRSKGSILKAARLSLTPKQKASANILKNSKGWARKIKATEAKRGGSSTEKSESRVSDVVDSVLAATAPKANVDIGASTASREAPTTSIEDTIRALLSNVTAFNALTVETARVRPPTASTTTNYSHANISSKANVTTVSSARANVSTNDRHRLVGGPVPSAFAEMLEREIKQECINMDMERPEIIKSAITEDIKPSKLALLSSTPEPKIPKPLITSPRLPGKPPTLPVSARTSVQQPAGWVVPAHLRGFNATLAERAKESGKLKWSSRTDEVLRTIMAECKALRFSEEHVDAVLDDLGKRLKVRRATILARWDKIKPSPRSQDSSTKATNAPAATSANQEHKNSEDFSPVPLAGLLRLLRQEIDLKMPALEMDHRKLAEEAALKKLHTNGPEGERQRNVYTPRRKFSWNNRSRKILAAIVEKMVNRIIRDETIADKEEGMKIWLEQQVVPLWPSGWMNARELMKESKEVLWRIARTKELSTSPMDCAKLAMEVGGMVGVSPVLPATTTTLPTVSTSQASTKPSTVVPSSEPAAPTFRRPLLANPPVVLSSPASSPTKTVAFQQSHSTPKIAYAVSMAPKVTAQQQPRASIQSKMATAGAPIVSSPQRPSFSIHNLTMSVGQSSNSTPPRSSSGHRPVWQPAGVPTEEQKRIALQQQYAALMAAAANQGIHPPANIGSMWFQSQRR